MPSPRFRVEPRPLTSGEIDEIVAGHARAAELAAEAGLDGVEISAAHRYLIEQFLDPSLNRRDDAWSDGTRFLTAVLRAVRQAVPHLCLGVRLSADSQRVAGIAGLLAAEGVDYISLAIGDSSTYLGSVGIVPPPPVPDGVIAEHAGPFAGALPRITTSRIVDPLAADRLLADGRAEAVGMTRALITDPDMPAKARSGRLEEVVRCVGCNACIAHYHGGTPIRCAVNPVTGRELHLPARLRRARASGSWSSAPALPGSRRRSTPAVRATRSCCSSVRGGSAARSPSPARHRQAHNSPRRSSRMPPGSSSPRASSWRSGLRRPRPTCSSSNRTRSSSRPAHDRMWTTRLSFEGAEPTGAWEVLEGWLPLGDRVVVADWGGDQSGLDAAEVLAAAGKQVTLAVASLAPAELVHQYRRNLYLQRLYRAGVTILHHHELESVAGDSVRLRNVFAPELIQTVHADDRRARAGPAAGGIDGGRARRARPCGA